MTRALDRSSQTGSRAKPAIPMDGVANSALAAYVSTQRDEA